MFKRKKSRPYKKGREDYVESPAVPPTLVHKSLASLSLTRNTASITPLSHLRTQRRVHGLLVDFHHPSTLYVQVIPTTTPYHGHHIFKYDAIVVYFHARCKLCFVAYDDKE